MKPNRAIALQKSGRLKNRNRRPFWLPAPTFYILAAVISTVLFFVVLAVTFEGGEDNSVLTAAFGAVAVMGGAMFLREIILRKARLNYLAAQKQLDFTIGKVSARFASNFGNKITLEQNAVFLQKIKTKSAAAKVLGDLPEAHREVYELCDEYLAVTGKQLQSVGMGSPRLAAFRHGRESVKRLHRFHLLIRAEAESKKLIQKAQINVTISEKLDAAQQALDLIESALQFYPNELNLSDSKNVLKEFITSIKVSHWMESAEKAIFDNDFQSAAAFYKDALFFLERGSLQETEKVLIIEKINSKLKEISSKESKKTIKFSAPLPPLEDKYD